MNYRHLTVDELVRHIGAQVGNDLELEGELVRRVVAGEVVLGDSDALAEKQDEIDGLEETVKELEGTVDAKQVEIDALQKLIDDAANKLEAVAKELAPA